MREQTGIVFDAPRRAPAPRVRNAVSPKTMEDALTPEVAHENAASIAALFGQVKGMKRAT